MQDLTRAAPGSTVRARHAQVARTAPASKDRRQVTLLSWCLSGVVTQPRRSPLGAILQSVGPATFSANTMDEARVARPETLPTHPKPRR